VTRSSRILGTVGLAMAVALARPAVVRAQEADSCLKCHLEATGNERVLGPARDFQDDIHRAKGFDCTSCHGGDRQVSGLASKDPARGYIGVPARQAVPAMCGKCHSDPEFMKRYNPALRVDQALEYETSVHGKRLRSHTDPKVAVCTSCHTAHSIRPASDPKSTVYPSRIPDLCGHCHADSTLMEGYQIPTDQLENYKTSVHWKAISEKGDLSAPACNGCHGNHGATPPGIASVQNVCGQCHSVMSDFFSQSPHAKAFAEKKMPACATCHSNHEILTTSDDMLGLGEESFCVRCHSADGKAGKAAVEMLGLVRSLREAADQAGEILQRAEASGMEVSKDIFDLTEARNAIILARNSVHLASVDAVKKEVDRGLEIASTAHARGEKALKEYDFRRKGLAISLGIILAVIAGLVLAIRRLERRPAGGDEGQETRGRA
jgi:predicted CXXCH cytochrome family protein